MSTVTIKTEPSDSESNNDERLFSHLQTRIERLKEEMKQVRQQLKPIHKRLRKKMEEESLQTLQCGEFVLTQSVPESDEGSEPGVVFNEKHVTSFFDEDMVSAYMNDPKHHRKPRKRPRFSCERQVVDVSNSNEASSSDTSSDSDGSEVNE